MAIFNSKLFVYQRPILPGYLDGVLTLVLPSHCLMSSIGGAVEGREAHRLISLQRDWWENLANNDNNLILVIWRYGFVKNGHQWTQEFREF